MVNATIKTASNCRWGPNTSYYLLDSSSSLAYEEPVQILWQEGNFYYIQYSTSNGTKRMYYPINYIENISGTVPVKTLNPDVRYVTAATSVKYSPLSTAPSAGSLGKLENVSLLIDSSTDDPVEVGNYFFIEYSTSNTSSNNTVYRKRAWINKSYLRTAPNVTNPSVVYADTDGITTAQMNANARYIFAYLTALGFSAQAACGILGNMQQESTINPGM